MKKWLYTLAACLLALCLTACGGASGAAPVPTESPDLLDAPREFRTRPAEQSDAADEWETSGWASDAPDEWETSGRASDAPDEWETSDWGPDESPDEWETPDWAADAPDESPEASAPQLPPTPDAAEIAETSGTAAEITERGSYTTAQDVARYIRLYGRLPGNFITKREARELGWNGGSLEPYAPGKCIGGDRFGNYEGLLPSGRAYRECDIDTLGAKSRGSKRLVFSDDGLIYYTSDHYNTFTLLYGDE